MFISNFPHLRLHARLTLFEWCQFRKGQVPERQSAAQLVQKRLPGIVRPCSLRLHVQQLCNASKRIKERKYSLKSTAMVGLVG